MARERGGVWSHLSYANVVATLALFIALGGASYAAVELPAASVGPAQLKPKAVTLGKLAFPLGAAGTTDPAPEDLSRLPGCNAPLPPGRVLNIDCPLQLAVGQTLPRLNNQRELTLRLSGPGELLVSGAAGLRNEGPLGTSARVTAALAVDGVVIAHPALVVQGQTAQELPLDSVIEVGAGNHHVAVAFAVSYSSYLPGDTIAGPVTLVASALPRP